MAPTVPAQCTEAEVDSLLERGEEPAVEVPTSSRAMRKVAVAALASTAALACVLGLSGAHARGPAHTSWGAVSGGLFVKDSAYSYPGANSSPSSQSLNSQMFSAPSAGAQTAAQSVSQVATSQSSIAPNDNKHDGNLCGDDEEEFGKACYKKCQLLTRGKAPYRTSPFSCCPTSHCPMKEEMISVRMCDGYDVAGDSEGRNKCPHKEGVCYENEELHLGMCYKKCSELTGGVYPHRKTAWTCCKSSTIFPDCLNPANTDTSMNYAVGGGKGDGDSNTESSPHQPKTSLAEQVA